MKKKIKDLSFEEMTTICCNNSCGKCPLNIEMYNQNGEVIRKECYKNAYFLVNYAMKLKEKEVLL